jgi:hypothetical protein
MGNRTDAGNFGDRPHNMPNSPASEAQIREIKCLAVHAFGQRAQYELKERYLPVSQMNLVYADKVIRDLKMQEGAGSGQHHSAPGETGEPLRERDSLREQEPLMEVAKPNLAFTH